MKYKRIFLHYYEGLLYGRPMLDTRRLQVLSAVVETGSITGAASLLGYTPSAVSQSIATLERETHTALLERVGRGVQPTQAGALLAEHAEAVLDRLREAEGALAALRAGQAGHLQLTTFATAGAALVPRALARFRAAHRGVELDLRIAEIDDALAQLRAGRSDIAVVAFESGSPAALDADLRWTHLLDDPYRIVVPRSHPLAGRRTLSPEQLRDETWVATASPACDSRAVVTAACAKVGVDPRFGIVADEFSTAMGFVSAELGVAMVPLLGLSSVPDNVRVRRIRGTEPVRRVYAVTRAASAAQPTVAAMVDALQESGAAYLASAA
jgi:DNA-binding transcriptional LysR family regulator